MRRSILAAFARTRGTRNTLCLFAAGLRANPGGIALLPRPGGCGYGGVATAEWLHFPLERQNQCAFSGPIAVFAEVNALPNPQAEAAIFDRHADGSS